MISTASDLAFLFNRDLTRLSRQIEDFPSDEMLWEPLPGVLNPAGNLALHIEGIFGSTWEGSWASWLTKETESLNSAREECRAMKLSPAWPA